MTTPDDDQPGRLTRSGGTFAVNNVDSAWEQRVYDFIKESPREPAYDLSILIHPPLETDPLLDEAPRGLFRRETWTWIKAVASYTWRAATGGLRRVGDEVRWDLAGIEIVHMEFGFSGDEPGPAR